MGREAYPGTTELLITADCGGSNSARSRLWKVELHSQIAITLDICSHVFLDLERRAAARLNEVLKKEKARPLSKGPNPDTIAGRASTPGRLFFLSQGPVVVKLLSTPELWNP